jgi:leucyl/phenylalanyl-tRNA--protein transferase
MRTLPWLSRSAAVDFPPPDEALTEPNGLLAAGGDLEPERLLAAYRRGIFPWYDEGQPILWWSPDPRAVLWLDGLHVSRSLRRSLRNGRFEFRVDTAFDDVVAACAAPRSYGRLHHLGWAHSFETWRDDMLVGGLYGVALGRVFFGESMFTRATDASKVAFVHTVQFLRERQFALIDCQVASAHTMSLGATNIGRSEFLRLVAQLCEPPGTPCRWS